MSRILFVSHTAERSGPTNSLTYLLQHLRHRFDVEVLVRGDGEFTAWLAQAGIPYTRMHSLRKNAIPAMYRMIRQGRFDLVYGNNTSGASRNAFIAARLSGAGFICHIRCMQVARAKWRLAFLRHADATVAVSEATARAMAPYTGARAPHVVYNGIPPEWLRNVDRTVARRAIREELKIPPDAPLLVNLGNISRRKGQADSVRAFAELLQHFPSARLVLAGSLDNDTTYVAEVRRLAAGLGIAEHVSLVGFRKDVDTLLAAADCCLHTATADPHPRAVLEAMAAGLPVAAFAVDGVAETVVQDRTGLLVPVNDCSGLAREALRLLRDPRHAAQLGRDGQARIASLFTAEVTARKVGEIIERTVATRAAGRFQRRRKTVSDPVVTALDMTESS